MTNIPAGNDAYAAALDAVFKRDDLRGVYPDELDEGRVYEAAAAFAAQLNRRGGEEGAPGDAAPRIAVGYDARVSSPGLAAVACQGVAAAGGIPIPVGLCSTEMIYFACSAGERGGGLAGGIMLTASHNPAAYNGMKFLLRGGAPLGPAGLQELRRGMCQWHQEGAPRVDYARLFREFLLSRTGWQAAMPPLPSPLTVVVSAGNGVGAVAFAPLAACLAGQGIDVHFMEEEPDGRFPHGVPNPLLPEFMSRLAARVRECHAALGIGFDGDADRAGFVDESGQVLSSAEVYVAIARHKLASLGGAGALPGRPVLMRNLCCSQYILDAFRGDAVEIVDTPVGHGQIKRLMRAPQFQGRVIFAGEHSGHYFYPEFASVDSGMMSALLMLQILRREALAGRRLSELFAAARQNYCWSGELNAELPSRAAVERTLARACAMVRERFPRACRMEVHPEAGTGLNRVYRMPPEAVYRPADMGCPDLKLCLEEEGAGWWMVLRPSGNEPKLRLNVEAYGAGCRERCRELTAWLKEELLAPSTEAKG